MPVDRTCFSLYNLECVTVSHLPIQIIFQLVTWRYTYTKALCLEQWKVRRTLAFSIHELAVILGDQLTAADLVPIFNGFLKDLDEVRIGVLKHLFDFLKVSPAPTNPAV